MLKRLALSALILALTCIGASAADCFNNTGATQTDCGIVNMYLNGSSQAVSVTPTTPMPVSPTAFPSGATAITAASGTVAAGSAVATLAAVAAKTTYICGFVITSTGSTAAAVVAPTIANTITGTLTFAYASVAGATLANQSLVVPFTPCVPASAVNTTIVVTLPSLGAGSTNATVNAWGYQL